MRFLFPLIFFGSLSFSAFSQSVEVIPSLGIMNYQGDMAEFFINPLETNLAGGIGLRYHLNKAFAVRPQITIGKISGDDRHSVRNFRRQLSFEANVFETLLFLDYNLLHANAKHHYGRTSMRRMSFYLSLGAGFTLADAFVNTDNAPVEAFKVPFPEPDDKAFFTTVSGAGVLAYRISEQTSLSAQAGFRYVFSDYLDGLSQNGRPDFNDWYWYAGLGLAIKLNRPVRCPGF